MRCPYCGTDRDKVVDSRPAEEGATVRRRRECTGCGQRFSTYERVEHPPMAVRKRDGRVVAFDPQRVADGIRKATANLDIEPGAALRAAAHVEARVRRSGRREVDSATVGAEVLDVLRDLHHVAYVRFASVYKGFTSPEDFVRELATLDKAEDAASREATDEPG